MKMSLRILRLMVWLRRSSTIWLERAKMHEQLFAIVVAVVIGVLGGFGVVGFRLALKGMTSIFWGAPELTTEVAETVAGWVRILVPILGGILVAPIVMRWVKEAQGYGVPEVMEAVGLKKSFLSIRLGVGKAVASILTLASGGSAGREGPIILIGASIGSTVGRWLRVSAIRLRTFVACGASAGIAATFNAPIAGALFSVEKILGETGFARFGPIVVASVTATVISRHYLGDEPVFMVPEYSLVSPLEMIPVLLLGVICALVGYALMRVLGWMEDLLCWRNRVPSLLRPAAGGALLAAIAWWVPHVYGDGHQTINLALNGSLSLRILLLLVFAKMVATASTVSSGGSGGVFAPSLFIGATLGGAFGEIIELGFGGGVSHPGMYALIGMGGVVAATTHAPITAIVIIFEITSNYNIILPLMVVCIISAACHSRITHHSIYTMKLARRGVTLYRGRSLDRLKEYGVAQFMRRGIGPVDVNQPLASVLPRVLNSEETHFYVCDDQQRFVGMILLSNLRRVFINRESLEQVLLVEDITDERIPTCDRGESLSNAMIRFEQTGLSELPVVDPVNRGFLGALHYQDVVAVYNNEMMLEDSAEGVATRITAHQAEHKVTLVEGYEMVEWDPPGSFHGQRLLQLKLPRRYGVHVILIKRRLLEGDTLESFVPDADTVIQDLDRLLIYGRTADVDAVLKV